MDAKEIDEITKKPGSRTNKDLFDARDLLEHEFDETKEFIIDLTRHLDVIIELHRKINDEIVKRSEK